MSFHGLAAQFLCDWTSDSSISLLKDFPVASELGPSSIRLLRTPPSSKTQLTCWREALGNLSGALRLGLCPPLCSPTIALTALRCTAHLPAPYPCEHVVSRARAEVPRVVGLNLNRGLFPRPSCIFSYL